MNNSLPKYQGRDLLAEGIFICSKCIYDESVAGISFDQEGVCNYCRLIENLSESYATGTIEGLTRFQSLVDLIKKQGKRKPYDVIVGVSGGTDSSYTLWIAKQYGLRPLAVHYDNTWNTSIATENIRKVTQALSVDLHTYVCENKEADDIFRSFFLAGVPEIDGATDIALAEVIYRVAARYNVKYVFEGHSFMAEGVSPLQTAYVDGRYISGIHKQFGQLPMKSFPNMNFMKFLYWTVVKRIKKIRPLWYLNYSKEQAKKELTERFGWIDYGGHHLENRMTAFHHSYYNPTKFKLDQRNNSLSASVRSGIISRAEALKIYATPPFVEENLVEFVMKRFNMTQEKFQGIMTQEPKYYFEFPTYKQHFEFLRPLFFLLEKKNLVPRSFYLKYCFPAPKSKDLRLNSSK